MKKIYTVLLGASLISTLFSCRNEDPFNTEIQDGEGRFLTSSLNLQVKVEEVESRASKLPSVDDFTVAFCKKETPTEAFLTYSYKALPEVVSLPVGDYIVKAFYGNDNIVAAFDSPAYYGELSELTIEKGKIVDVKEPIICSLYNVRVSVNFDPELLAVMGDNAKVTVKVGESGTLDFFKDTTSDGFFKYDEESHTLVATFSGDVNGAFITEIKSYDKVVRGTYYKITFKLRNVETGAEDPGSVSNGALIVDATVTFHDYSSNGGMNVDPETEEYLEDDRYPWLNGGNEDPEGPDTPDTPDLPDTEGLPQLVSDDVDIDATTDISNWEGSLKVKIYTTSPISAFKCLIDSSTLTKDELESVDLTDDLDLVNDIYEKQPGESESEIWKKLRALGFPVGEDVTNPQEMEDGKYVITFDITTFVPLLNVLGEGKHNFVFTLTNSSGTTKKTLKLESKKVD